MTKLFLFCSFVGFIYYDVVPFLYAIYMIWYPYQRIIFSVISTISPWSISQLWSQPWP